jgi:hypothetical protein
VGQQLSDAANLAAIEKVRQEVVLLPEGELLPEVPLFPEVELLAEVAPLPEMALLKPVLSTCRNSVCRCHQRFAPAANPVSHCG